MNTRIVFALILAASGCAETTIPRRTSLTTHPAPGQFFTLGDNKDVIIHVLGQPSEIDTFPSSDEEWWSFGFSRVFFNGGRVSGWESNDLEAHPLKAYCSKESNATSFAQGSSFQDVIAAMGTPTGIRRMSSGLIWVHYGRSRVDLKHGAVVGWDNKENNLRLSSTPAS